MKRNLVLCLFILIKLNVFVISNESVKKPTIVISILIRNKAHTLPYFLTLFEQLEYPKNRICLWIRSDNNVDNSIEILNVWLNEQKFNYHSVNVVTDNESKSNENEESIADWTTNRFIHVINLREEALNFGRNIWADYLFMVDADVFLTNPKTLELLISKNETLVAPMLKSDGMYSNYWAGMTSEYYYERTDTYIPILNREKIGCHPVPMIHSAVLINLREKNTDFLTYNSDNLQHYNGPKDDIITFALAANASDVPLHICNDEIYGYVMIPLESQDTLERDYQQLINLKLEVLGYQAGLPLSNSMKSFVKYPKKDTMGMDCIYMINLVRRPERRARMHHCFDELGIDAETIDAVDGRSLNESILDKWGVKMMPDYADPYHKRPMKMGEIGCFLSHFLIWNKMIDNGYDKIMVLEDDVRFEPFFRHKVNFIMNEIEKLSIKWDLIYLGRKRMQIEEETLVEGSNHLVHAGYSYWTLGYILSSSGAKKLLDAKPLDTMVPVDEYLPILFDKHPRENWKQHFPKRDLVALSSAPLLIYPTHYTGENGYISDTENSTIIQSEIIVGISHGKIEL
ncbi:hypothetical protein PV328_001313 [Microctonus aethiopoides]|uniref:Glycosyl transferase family 25 domain-containing protein n=1 Tax=Microctonus aethiopoides TaxID=144406 RepID=A0AA39KXF4_9HYME|nr:hypothetical protein PV328_001313 [Microctonus aethiopoides]